MFGNQYIPLDIYKEIIKFLSPEDMLRLCSANRFFNSNKKALCIEMFPIAMRNINQVHDVFYASENWYFVKGQGEVWVYSQETTQCQQLRGISNVKQICFDWGVKEEHAFYCLQTDGMLWRGVRDKKGDYAFTSVCENVSQLAGYGLPWCHLIVKKMDNIFKGFKPGEEEIDIPVSVCMHTTYPIKRFLSYTRYKNNGGYFGLVETENNLLVEMSDKEIKQRTQGVTHIVSEKGRSPFRDIYISNGQNEVLRSTINLKNFGISQVYAGVQNVHKIDIRSGTDIVTAQGNKKASYGFYYQKDGSAGLCEMFSGTEKCFQLNEKVIDIHRNRDNLIFILESGRIQHVRFGKEEELQFFNNSVLPNHVIEVEIPAVKKIREWYEKEFSGRKPQLPSGKQLDEDSLMEPPLKKERPSIRG